MPTRIRSSDLTALVHSRGKHRRKHRDSLQKVRSAAHHGQPFDAPSKPGLLMACGRRTRNEMNLLIDEARRMALSKGQRPASKGTCVVYFLRLRSGALYIGASEDIEQRLDDHLSGQACRTTQLDPPASFLTFEVYPTFSEARSREAQLKRWSRAKKEALLSGEFERLHALSQSRESAKLLNTQG